MIETVVTLGAAVLMTVAGFAMIEDTIVAHVGGTLVGAIVAPPASAVVAAPRSVASRG